MALKAKEIVDRIQSITGLNQSQIAIQIFDKSKNSFNNQIRAGRLDWDILAEWAIHKNVDIRWLLTGQESPYDKTTAQGDEHSLPQDSIPIANRRITPQNQREGIISNFKDKEMARQTILALNEIEKLDRDHYIMLAGEIRGAARALRPKKMA